MTNEDAHTDGQTDTIPVDGRGHDYITVKCGRKRKNSALHIECLRLDD